MRNIVIIILALVGLFSCQKEEENLYTNNELSYQLFQGSEFNYTGEVRVRERIGGEVEITLTLNGNKGNTSYFFPAHLHFGGYDSADSPIASLLTPIDIRELKSTTVLGKLSDGRSLSFDDFKNFDGHIKVHLADSGPEYAVILSVGNVGRNSNALADFDPSKMTMCSPYMPE